MASNELDNFMRGRPDRAVVIDNVLRVRMYEAIDADEFKGLMACLQAHGPRAGSIIIDMSRVKQVSLTFKDHKPLVQQTFDALRLRGCTVTALMKPSTTNHDLSMFRMHMSTTALGKDVAFRFTEPPVGGASMIFPSPSAASADQTGNTKRVPVGVVIAYADRHTKISPYVRMALEGTVPTDTVREYFGQAVDLMRQKGNPPFLLVSMVQAHDFNFGTSRTVDVLEPLLRSVARHCRYLITVSPSAAHGNIISTMISLCARLGLPCKQFSDYPDALDLIRALHNPSPT